MLIFSSVTSEVILYPNALVDFDGLGPGEACSSLLEDATKGAIEKGWECDLVSIFAKPVCCGVPASSSAEGFGTASDPCSNCGPCQTCTTNGQCRDIDGCCFGDSDCTGTWVCDTDNNECVECTGDSDCADSLVCDEDNGNVCVECIESDDCDGDCVQCSILGQCVPIDGCCVEDDECEDKDEDFPFCNTNDNVCAECTLNSHCDSCHMCVEGVCEEVKDCCEETKDCKSGEFCVQPDGEKDCTKDLDEIDDEDCFPTCIDPTDVCDKDKDCKFLFEECAKDFECFCVNKKCIYYP